MVYMDVPSSPSKASLKKRIPSGAAVVAARRLLNSFVITNTPEAISSALPFYDDPRKDESFTQAGDDGSLESAIGPQSMIISRAKNCWSILVQGFTQRGQIRSMRQDKGKKRSHNLDEDDEPTNDLENVVVGEDAWPTLEWLITLFEQDEILADTRGSVNQKSDTYLVRSSSLFGIKHSDSLHGHEAVDPPKGQVRTLEFIRDAAVWNGLGGEGFRLDIIAAQRETKPDH
ncbi:hypothetical protein C0991_011389 [Blastosporella zonata]|nr:hypothetical protein C0991_011389 [Blastosporella zonata]